VSSHAGHLRIGELGRRVGVSPELLRAWEHRYGLLQPSRSTGGFRLYSETDEARIHAMHRHLSRGLSAAQAAEAALAETLSAEAAFGGSPCDEVLTPGLAGTRAKLQSALERFDEATAHALLDRLLAALAIDTVLGEVILPVIRSIGEGWAEGRTTVAQEHFTSHLLRGRLCGLARGWGRGSGPVAVLACPPGELHDLPLIIFGIALREAGWCIAFLGADTPIETIESAATTLQARLAVLSTVSRDRFRDIEPALAELGRGVMVALGGAGAESALAARVGAVLFAGDPVSAAATFAAEAWS
jgi:DNA-binding transcriptional MerR regulator